MKVLEPQKPVAMQLYHFRYVGGPCDGMVAGPCMWPVSYMSADSVLCHEVTKGGQFSGNYRIRLNPDEDGLLQTAHFVP